MKCDSQRSLPPAQVNHLYVFAKHFYKAGMLRAAEIVKGEYPGMTLHALGKIKDEAESIK